MFLGGQGGSSPVSWYDSVKVESGCRIGKNMISFLGCGFLQIFAVCSDMASPKNFSFCMKVARQHPASILCESFRRLKHL